MRTVEQEQARYRWPTTKETGELIGGVTPEHVIRLIHAGELAARDVSLPTSKRPDYRVDPASIDSFNERRMVKPEAAA